MHALFSSAMKILLIGVGGVGCEFLILFEEYCKSLTESTDIFVIDDDIVEESNLNRQRLYTAKDIGRPKVEAACESLKQLKLIPLKAKVETIADLEFFSQFQLVVLAVDNLETRRWINSAMFQSENRDFFLLDLGVEGFKFSIRSVRRNTACLECTMNLYTEEENVEKVPICSIYGQPRNLKDCVYWSLNKAEDSGDVKSIYELTKERANEFGIDSTDLSYQSISSLMKQTIPAVASVNSLLAAKALEILLKREEIEANFWLTNLENGIYEFETTIEKNNECFICN